MLPIAPPPLAPAPAALPTTAGPPAPAGPDGPSASFGERLAAASGAAGPDPSPLAGPGGPGPLLAGEAEALRALPGRWEALREKVHARLAGGVDLSGQELLLLQLEMNRIAFQVETASKVVEHAVAGTRTVLQTQT